MGSTDSNIPISLGIPAVTLDSGGTGGRAHALDEWITSIKRQCPRRQSRDDHPAYSFRSAVAAGVAL
jgi:hypothetical protein